MVSTLYKYASFTAGEQAVTDGIMYNIKTAVTVSAELPPASVCVGHEFGFVGTDASPAITVSTVSGDAIWLSSQATTVATIDAQNETLFLTSDGNRYIALYWTGA